MIDLAAPVAALDARVVSVPLEPRIVTANYRITTIEMVLLRARDADGAEGVATLWCFGVPQARVLTATLEYLAPLALRAGDPRIAAVVAELRREINFFGFKGVSVFGLSAFDLALHDLALRRSGTSLSAALGRRRDAVPAYWSGLFLNQPVEELEAEVDAKLAAGFRAFKLRTGKADLEEDVRRTEAVVARLPPGATLMLDAVQSWTPAQAIAAAERLAGYGPRWLEDPLVHLDYAGLAEVVARSPIPVATGENEYLLEGFEQVLAAGCPYLLADLQRVGGITEWRKVAEAAAARGAVLTPHVFPHVALQLCAALEQDEVWLEWIPWWEHLAVAPLEVRDGAAGVPDSPGLGLDLDWERVDAQALGPWLPLGA